MVYAGVQMTHHIVCCMLTQKSNVTTLNSNKSKFTWLPYREQNHTHSLQTLHIFPQSLANFTSILSWKGSAYHSQCTD